MASQSHKMLHENRQRKQDFINNLFEEEIKRKSQIAALFFGINNVFFYFIAHRFFLLTKLYL